MGGICTTERSAVNQQVIKLLLLGCPNAGKSTVFKQMTLLYSEGFSSEFRNSAALFIVDTLLEAIEILHEYISKAEPANLSPELLKDLEKLKEFQEQVKAKLPSSECGQSSPEPLGNINEILLNIQKFSQNPVTKKVVDKLKEPEKQDMEDETFYRLPESTFYYLERISQLDLSSGEGFQPTDQDLLRLRRVTVEAESMSFQTELEWPPRSGTMVSVPVNCSDVGGQAHHEFDWVQHGASATSIVFVMCLSDFDEVDENGSNKLKESLSLLRKIASSPSFQGKPFVILFNKSDLLREKLYHKRVADFFTSYMGDNSERDVIEYFEERVRQLVEASVQEATGFSSEVSVSVLQTCAVNSQLMKDVLTRVFLGLFQSTVRQVWS